MEACVPVSVCPRSPGGGVHAGPSLVHYTATLNPGHSSACPRLRSGRCILRTRLVDNSPAARHLVGHLPHLTAPEKIMTRTFLAVTLLLFAAGVRADDAAVKKLLKELEGTYK